MNRFILSIQTVKTIKVTDKVGERAGSLNEPVGTFSQSLVTVRHPRC